MRTEPPPPTQDATLRRLLVSAASVRQRAYAPYSKFAVGAAVLADDGKVYAGCNVENASYPVGICAERGAIAQAVAGGAKAILAAALVAKDTPLPCGMCLQTFSEFGAPQMPILLATPEGEEEVLALEDLLPRRFHLQGD